MNGRGQNAEISQEFVGFKREDSWNQISKSPIQSPESLEDFAQIQVFGQILVAHVEMCPIGSI